MVLSTHLGTTISFSLLSDSCGFADVGCPLCWEDGSVLYNYCRCSPAQSFSGPSHVGHTVIFYCPTSLRVRSPYLYSLGTGWPSYTQRYRLLFSLLLTTQRAMVEIFNLPPHGIRTLANKIFRLGTDHKENTVYHLCVIWTTQKTYLLWCKEHEHPLPSNGHCIQSH